MGEFSIVGVDLAKNVFEVHASTTNGVRQRHVSCSRHREINDLDGEG